MPKFFVTLLIISVAFSLYTPKSLFAANITPVSQKATISVSPHTSSFLENSTFEVPIFINSHGDSINAIELHVNFDAKKLNIIKPSSGKSVITLWAEPPSYSNVNGTVKIVGTIPNGIITDNGLITTITFKAIAPGETVVAVSNGSRVLANDGYGTEVALNVDRGTYSILYKPPEDIKVFSETHPFTDKWYNNNNPVLSWEKAANVSDFSYVLDNKPNTIPDNTAESNETGISYQNLPDGISYFHIKGHKKNTWGGTTHFPVRIDTKPPAAFTPTSELITAASETSGNKVLLSFFTTDNMSGIDHYEVGLIDKTTSAESSPILVQAESPFQLPTLLKSEARVMVRAFDQAGNVQDATLDINAPQIVPSIVKENLMMILTIAFGILLLLIILHYLTSHHVLKHFRKALEIVHQQEAIENQYVPQYSMPEPYTPPQQAPVPLQVKLPVQSQPLQPAPQPVVTQQPLENTYIPPADSVLHR